MRVHVEIELADRKTAKFTPSHKKSFYYMEYN
jgi:hypothetical protein